jgi:hypothetical protein
MQNVKLVILNTINSNFYEIGAKNKLYLSDSTYWLS